MRTVIIAALLPALGLALAGCPDSSQNPDTSTGSAQVCADIHAAIDSGMLDARGTRVEIQLHAAHAGVTDRIRAAVDTYYRGDHAAGRQAMLSACAVAGYPVKP